MSGRTTHARHPVQRVPRTRGKRVRAAWIAATIVCGLPCAARAVTIEPAFDAGVRMDRERSARGWDLLARPGLTIAGSGARSAFALTADGRFQSAPGAADWSRTGDRIAASARGTWSESVRLSAAGQSSWLENDVRDPGEVLQPDASRVGTAWAALASPWLDGRVAFRRRSEESADRHDAREATGAATLALLRMPADDLRVQWRGEQLEGEGTVVRDHAALLAWRRGHAVGVSSTWSAGVTHVADMGAPTPAAGFHAAWEAGLDVMRDGPWSLHARVGRDFATRAAVSLERRTPVSLARVTWNRAPQAPGGALPGVMDAGVLALELERRVGDAARVSLTASAARLASLDGGGVRARVARAGVGLRRRLTPWLESRVAGELTDQDANGVVGFPTLQRFRIEAGLAAASIAPATP